MNKSGSSVPSDPLTNLVRSFLESNLSIILVIFSLILGGAALVLTPREEDPQIVVPIADIYVDFSGHSAAEVEQLISTPLERALYQIDGVEYVYSMSRENQAIITVRFHVGEDRERSLVKLFKKIDESAELIPPGVSGWVIKPVEIDDVPIVTLALKEKDLPTVTDVGIAPDGSEKPDVLNQVDSHLLRRIGEELVQRISSVSDVSRATVIGGEPRLVRVEVDSDQLRGHNLNILAVQNAIRGANAKMPAGSFTMADKTLQVDVGSVLVRSEQLGDLVVGVNNQQPVFLKDVAKVVDGPAEVTAYVRHNWGPARGFELHANAPGTVVGESHGHENHDVETGQAVAVKSGVHEVRSRNPGSNSAVILAISKQKGANAVDVANRVLKAAEQFRENVLPENVQLIVTRNNGLTANEKVNELVEGLVVAIIIVIVLLVLVMGWREALIITIAVPVVFGLTLAVNLLLGYTINRVTLFALILSIGLLVDDPIVDVENIARHFEEKKKATREIVLGAVSEIRPPLISATLAVIVSFLPLFFITGMMGPYMSPMAINVPVSMLMSMLVAFTITPWLTYHILGGKFRSNEGAGDAKGGAELHEQESASTEIASHREHLYDAAAVQQTFLYRFFRPLMLPLLKTRFRAAVFLMVITGLTVAAMGLAALRVVPLKMLPFDNKNEFLMLVDLEEGTTLERTNALILEFEKALSEISEVVDFTSFVGQPGPIDFNGLVRHYYLRQSPHLAELRVNLVGKKNRKQQSHAITLRERDRLTQLAERHGAKLKIVELPPGPPVLASMVAEVTGSPDLSYEELLAASDSVVNRLEREPGVVEVDSTREISVDKHFFAVDQEKAALAGISVADIAQLIQVSLIGSDQELIRMEGERNPLRIQVRLPRQTRSNLLDLSQLALNGSKGRLVPVSELGVWQKSKSDTTIYHKNLERIVYVFAECAGRPPAECIIDVQFDRDVLTSASDGIAPAMSEATTTAMTAASTTARPLGARSYFNNGGGVPWSVPEKVKVNFAGEGEWKITLDVFRDLGLAFGAALLMIYIILVAQTGSFMLPVVVMLSIPLTVLGVMPGFWLLNLFNAKNDVGGYADPVFFTATAMIGMIALTGIVTRDAIILVDFIELSVKSGRSLFDAILESRVVRLRPILLTAGAAMLSAIPITFDPIFSGLGWALIFGLIASTLFTLFVIPATYWLIKARN